jgi:hypothetical protein
MSDSPTDLDFKFLPDWLKEGAAANRYADYEGDTGDRPRRDFGDRGGRPGGGGDRRGPRPPQRGDRDQRGPRPGGERRPGGRDNRGPGGPGGPRREGGRNDAGQDRRPPREESRAPQAPAVKVEFLPEPNCVVGIAKQIRSSGRAYPLFGTARLFLEKPERHRVRITSLDPAVPLHQAGDGPVSFDRALVERSAFRQLKDEYYSEEVAQGEPLKGNFTNVARCRSTGTFLGPTSYHGYQPALRKLYEERFSRRMSFPEFQREEIQILNDEQAIADWKEQARASTTYVTKQEAEPVTLKTPHEVEQHFRENYLPKIVKSGTTLETSGHASRAITERGILAALRETWDHERGFPQNLVNLLRPHLVESGLHFFKHRKRILFVSPVRPLRHTAGEIFSEGISSILTAVSEHPKITRPQLAGKLLGEGHEAPEAAPKKAALASDLHYLIRAGHVIEFHDGTLDLPLAPNAKPEPEGEGEKKSSAKQGSIAAAATGAPAAAAPSDEPAAEEVAAAIEPEGAVAAEPTDEPTADSRDEAAAELPPASAVQAPQESGETGVEPTFESQTEAEAVTPDAEASSPVEAPAESALEESGEPENAPEPTREPAPAAEQ